MTVTFAVSVFNRYFNIITTCTQTQTGCDHEPSIACWGIPDFTVTCLQTAVSSWGVNSSERRVGGAEDSWVYNRQKPGVSWNWSWLFSGDFPTAHKEVSEFFFCFLKNRDLSSGAWDDVPARSLEQPVRRRPLLQPGEAAVAAAQGGAHRPAAGPPQQEVPAGRQPPERAPRRATAAGTSSVPPRVLRFVQVCTNNGALFSWALMTRL